MFPFRQHAFRLRSRCTYFCALALLALHSSLHAQENYFRAYSHEMEEPGNLEFAAKSVTGAPKGGDAFLGDCAGVRIRHQDWWTTELYLDGQTTANQSTVFTGFRWEHRVRPLLREYWINPSSTLSLKTLMAPTRPCSKL